MRQLRFPLSRIFLLPTLDCRIFDLSVDRTQSEPDSGLTRDGARLFQRAEQSSTAARKGTTPGFKAKAQIPISSYGTSLATTERFLQAARCQSYR